MPELVQTELTLRPSLVKHALGLALCCACAAGGVLMVRDDQGWQGWAVLLIFGIGAIVFAAQMLPGASWLQLTGDGFRFCSLFRKSRLIPWTAVGSFGVASISRNAMVVFSSEEGSASRLAPVNRALVGETEALPDTYCRKAQDLASLLNQWRERAITGRP